MPKKNCIKLVRDFIVPNLDSKKFDNKLEWIDRERGIFGLNWIHKSNSQYSNEDGIVYEQWSQIKQLWNPHDPKAISKAKQRFRAALRKQRNLEKVEHCKNYRKYQIKDIKEIREELKRRQKNLKLEDNSYDEYSNYNTSESAQFNYEKTYLSNEDETHLLNEEFLEDKCLDYDSRIDWLSNDYWKVYNFSYIFSNVEEENFQLFEEI